MTDLPTSRKKYFIFLTALKIGARHVSWFASPITHSPFFWRRFHEFLGAIIAGFCVILLHLKIAQATKKSVVRMNQIEMNSRRGWRNGKWITKSGTRHVSYFGTVILTEICKRCLFLPSLTHNYNGERVWDNRNAHPCIYSYHSPPRILVFHAKEDYFCKISRAILPWVKKPPPKHNSPS